MINSNEKEQQQQNEGKENEYDEERAKSKEAAITTAAATVRREFENLITPAVEFFRLFNKNWHFSRYENYRYWIKMC